MANELRIDLTDPAMQEAFAECQPGETHTITLEVTVSENAEELVADVDPDSVEKYGDEEEEYEEINFEGVEYRLHSNGKVTNDFSLEVGTWVKDEERIVFIDEEMEEEHNLNRDE